MNNNDVFAHWRDSARQPRFYVVDARVVLFILLWLLHMRWWTFTLAVSAVTIFTIMEYFKYPLPVAIRAFKGIIIGKKKYRQ